MKKKKEETNKFTVLAKITMDKKSFINLVLMENVGYNYKKVYASLHFNSDEIVMMCSSVNSAANLYFELLNVGSHVLSELGEISFPQWKKDIQFIVQMSRIYDDKKGETNG